MDAVTVGVIIIAIVVALAATLVARDLKLI